MKRAAPEQVLQISVAQYLRTVLAPEVVWTAIGHGGGGRTRGALLKAMGLLPGVADIVIYWHAQKFHFHQVPVDLPAIGHIELKSTKAPKKPPPMQDAFAQRVLALGHHHAVCRSLDAVAASLALWGVPMRPHHFLKSGAVKLEEVA